MERNEYLSALSEFMYQGEVLGEAVFACYVKLETDASRRHKWATCLQLETETKARLRPFLAKLGLTVAQNDVSEIVSGFAKTFPEKSWQQHMEEIRSITDFYLEKFRAIEASAPADERDTVHSMVVHESALNDFARLELAGETKISLAVVVAELKWPIAYLQSAQSAV